MKKLLKNQKTPIIVCIITIISLVIVLIVLISSWSFASANLGKQQQWTSDKGSFDRAYEIAASDKDTPDKTLYVPKLTNILGKTIDEALLSIGQGASVVSSLEYIDPSCGAVSQTVINLNNESANVKSGTPSVIVSLNSSQIIVKATFTCNSNLLGFGNLSFVDLIDNEHITEKVLNESGLNVEMGSVVAPKNRAVYTTYDSDGTTVLKEFCAFDGTCSVDNHTYKWSSNLTIDYSIANAKGDLAETIRIISITIS